MNLRRVFRERLGDRALFANAAGWGLSLYDRALNRWPRLPLPGRRRPCRVSLAGIPQPFLLRLGTTDWLTMQEVFAAGEYAPLQSVSLGEVRGIIDLGANIGLTVRLWQRLFPQGQVLAVEPDPANAALLRRNLALAGGNGPAPVVLEACVLARRRSVRLLRDHGEWGYSARDLDAEAPGASPSPMVVTMPEVLREHFAGIKVDLLKCDIEGAEAEVFADCAAWIGAVRYAVVEVHAPYRVADLQADLRRNQVSFQTLHAREAGGYGLCFFHVDAVQPPA